MENNKLGLTSLVALCVGSMIGAGLFALPQNVAYTTGVAPLLLAWAITFCGILCLVKVFQNLTLRYPNLDAGVYAYAKEGLGDYLGFCSAWGYWISAWMGNIGFVIMFCSALSLFFPIFGDGTNIYSLILNSGLIWSITILCIRGIKSAALINNFTTFAKIIPIIVFIVLVSYNFNKDIFFDEVWQITELGSVSDQVKNMMLITVWTFIGIEGATVFSARAKNRSDVGKSTIIGFLIIFFILFVVSVAPFGIFTREELAVLPNPSTGAVLAHVAGNAGNVLINIGLITSVLGALLAWILMASEVTFVAGKKDGLFPHVFTIENNKGSPLGSLIITGICQQLYLIIAYFFATGYLVTVLLATSMILLPYLFSALFALMTAFSGKTYKSLDQRVRRKDCIISLLAVIYCVWIIYASGLRYLMLSSILYLIGNILFVINKLNRKQTIFKPYEILLWAVCSIIGVVCVVQTLKGDIIF